MSAPIPLRRDFGASQLRGLAKKTKDGPQARRLLALAAIYDGATRTEAAKIGGVGLQIIRDWVLHFNERGPDGLLNGKSPGQTSKLNDVQRQAIARMSVRRDLGSRPVRKGQEIHMMSSAKCGRVVTCSTPRRTLTGPPVTTTPKQNYRYRPG